MLRQLSLHHDYILLLVQDGYYLEALRYAQKNKVSHPTPLPWQKNESHFENMNLGLSSSFFHVDA